MGRFDWMMCLAALAYFGCVGPETTGDGGGVMACNACDDPDRDWCMGQCMERPDGFSFAEDEWCEWGWVGNVVDCGDQGGIALAQTQLPVDCRNSRNGGETLCAGDPGEVGEGIEFPGGSSARINAMWVDDAARVAYIGTHILLGTMPTTSAGAIMTVDLDTGDRALLSGLLEDPRTGRVEAGSGPEMDAVVALTGHPDGGLAVHAENGFFHVTGQGTRTLITDQRCFHVGFEWNYHNTASHPTISAGLDGTIYVSLGRPRPDRSEPPGWEEPAGIAAVDESGCSIVTMASDQELYRLAEGPVPTGEFLNVLVDGDSLVAMATFGELYRVDLATGDRVVLSDLTERVGEPGPDGAHTRDHDMIRGLDGEVWVASGELRATDVSRSAVAFVAIDLDTGNTRGEAELDKPVAQLSHPSEIALHPDSEDLVVLAGTNGVMLFERSTGNVNAISR